MKESDGDVRKGVRKLRPDEKKKVCAPHD